MVLDSRFKVFFGIRDPSSNLTLEEVYRADYSNQVPVPPPYTLYTQVTLGTSFAFFLVLIVTQALVNLLLETKLSREFKEAGWTAKMQHLLESVNRADSFADWDTGDGTQSEFQRRWWNVMAETILMIVLYQKWLHPWRRILAKEETPVDAQSPTNGQMSQDPEHSSEMEMAELHGPAQANGQESMIAQ